MLILDALRNDLNNKKINNIRVMKKMIKYVLIFCVLTNLVGCWDIQGSYDYTPINTDPRLKMTVWEFIESRQDTFSYMKQAIEYVDANYPGFKDLYTQTGQGLKYTYMLLSDLGFTSTSTSTSADAGPGVFKNLGIASNQITDIDPAVLREILLYHIAEGAYHCLDVSGSVLFEPVFILPLWKDPNSVMTIAVDDSKSSRTNFSRILANKNAGSSSYRRAVTSNLIATNGVIHVFKAQLVYVP